MAEFDSRVKTSKLVFKNDKPVKHKKSQKKSEKFFEDDEEVSLLFILLCFQFNNSSSIFQLFCLF